MPPRQEVYNVILAQLLQNRGLVVAPEEVMTRVGGKPRLPDVIVDFQGLRLIIEAETGKSRWINAYRKAWERVAQGVAHIGIAVVYPGSLRSAGFEHLTKAMESATLQFGIVSEASLGGEIQLELFPAAAARRRIRERLTTSLSFFGIFMSNLCGTKPSDARWRFSRRAWSGSCRLSQPASRCTTDRGGT